MKRLKDKYIHSEVESKKVYDNWIEKGYFTAKNKNKPAFSMVIPPPNVTGKLHLGHAWNTTLQDILARFKRMQGFDTLWLAGMDHAGIATQAKVEARLKEQGTDKYQLGRDKFLKSAWGWKEEYASHIREQWSKMGLSLDYSRERFTLDESLNEAVNKEFIDLYNAGLIYQGNRIINWDPEAQTALSNIEVIHKEVEGKFYTFKYPIVGSDKYLEVATTRPETMFADVCVVVNPNDEKFKHLHNSRVINPANGDELPIICDEYVEIGFGTGAMKCTPAHDPNDFMLGEKYNLERPNCMSPDGSMNELALEFVGLDRFDCRDKLVEKIKNDGNLVKIEKHIHQVGHSERTDCIVEPYLSKQWFVKMKPLAKAALLAQQKQEGINFYPNRFENVYCQWLEKIEDWCISRQLWWGHRIPAYYHKVTGEVVVGEPPKDIENYQQDEDVLDTWFSSALWPFSTLGWPDNSEDLQRYYPTSTLVTAYDIIFFWVARMGIQARHFTDKVPFKDCLIHGLVRDELGRKMSKSLGNGVDPLAIIESYGVDALRFFLTTNSTPGMDLRYSSEKVEASSNFINKIWNASRFVAINLPDNFTVKDLNDCELGFHDYWILEKLNSLVESVNKNMEKYEFAMVGNELYNFVWQDFCSSYIELAKSSIDNEATLQTLVKVLVDICKLLHPFMPFVTEEIFLCFSSEETICVSSWPTVSTHNNKDAFILCEKVLSIVEAVRKIKVQYNIKPSQIIDYQVKDSNGTLLEFNADVSDMVLKMAKGQWQEKGVNGELAIETISSGAIEVLLDNVIDYQAELDKTNKEITKITNEIKRAEGMLANQNFVNKAPEQKITAEKEKLVNYRKELKLLEELKQKLESK